MSQFLDDLKKEIIRQQANIFAIAEYCDGKLEALQLVKTNPCQDIYSVAKAYVVTAIGMLVDRGLLSTEECVTEILKQECPAGYQKIWDSITLEMLLLHKVPLPKNFLDIDVFDANDFGEDYLSHILNAPVDDRLPDFRYTDAAYYLLSRIVENRAGMGTDNFLWKNLFLPTGCREAAWSHCPMGHVMGATGLYIRAEDVAKLGAVYLNDGVWEGKRILSKTWVDTVFEKGYELKPQAGGCSFGKGGMRGQMLTIVPSKKRVVAYLGCGDYSFVDFIAQYQ